MSENPLYKKAYFQCARRAILENEVATTNMKRPHFLKMQVSFC